MLAVDKNIIHDIAGSISPRKPETIQDSKTPHGRNIKLIWYYLIRQSPYILGQRRITRGYIMPASCLYTTYISPDSSFERAVERHLCCEKRPVFGLEIVRRKSCLNL